MPSPASLFSALGLTRLQATTVLGVLGYALTTTLLAAPRPEPWALAALGTTVLLLPWTRRLFERLIPYLVFLLAVDAVRYGRDAFLTAERIVVCGIRSLEVKLFGFGSGLTPGEWLARHQTPSLDFFFATPYFVFAFVVLAYGLFLYFVDRPRMSRFLWAFAFSNLVAFVIWLLLPVAPPWYQHAFGCAADPQASPSPAGLLRVDEYLGIRYFSTFYSQSTYVFGAMPSLHCTYPMIGLLTAWKHVSWRTRPIHLAYVSLMLCASVYLDHHYLLDGLAGLLLAVVSVKVVSRFAAALESIHMPTPKALKDAKAA